MSKLDHIGINVGDLNTSVDFYDKVLGELEWTKKIFEHDLIGYTYDGAWLFLSQADEKFKQDSYHRKRIGLNHIAFFMDSKEKVDGFYKFLKQNNLNWLYDGPKEYPEYCKGYYALYFEDPDRIKLEVVYIPKN